MPVFACAHMRELAIDDFGADNCKLRARTRSNGEHPLAQDACRKLFDLHVECSPFRVMGWKMIARCFNTLFDYAAKWLSVYVCVCVPDVPAVRAFSGMASAYCWLIK